MSNDGAPQPPQTEHDDELALRALAELRNRLEVSRSTLGLSRVQLAARASLGRTTVSQALSSSAPPPSADTVVALARALRLDVNELLRLRRTAVEGVS
ncbi:helix-turn-helix domain-containing protein [Streptomyces broussonetiae]|uniref:Helix-turn-helix domain-containing protein n=2 Tax=Streptomyces broussonetiae TaxID=2686304 RepID=A0A6I6N8W8_9ACTN|nr:helix-turn-helix domain-containing protein [Streptomyces broussonetiae]